MQNHPSESAKASIEVEIIGSPTSVAGDRRRTALAPVKHKEICSLHLRRDEYKIEPQQAIACALGADHR